MTSRRARNAFLVLLMTGPLTGVTAIMTERAAAAAVTQFTDLSVSYPTSIASGPDGALWFTNNANNSIGRVTTAGAISNYSAPTIARPVDVTAGPDGAMWFTNYNNTIGRISTAGVVTNYTSPTISNPTSIFTGSDGALWFTNFNSNSIGRISTGGVVSNYANASSGPNNITAGPDGALWFTNLRNHAIGRITTGGVVTHYSSPGIDSPFSITSGPDGAMWFTNNGHHSIGRISMKGVVSHYANAAIANPLGITTGPDGAVWFDNVGKNSIGRITVETLPATVPDEPTGASVTYSGSADVSVGFVPGFSGGAPVVTYRATCTSLDSQPTGTATGTAGPITVTGLTSMHPYQCTVAAENLVGVSKQSAPSGVIWPGNTGVGCGVPSAPHTLSTAPGNASAVVSWAPAASGCVAGYIITPFLGEVAQSATLIPGQDTTTVLPGLTNGATYRFTVTAENGYVAGPPSAFSVLVTVGTPTAASALKAVKVAKGGIKVGFKPPRNNGAPITRYTATCRSANGGATKAKASKAAPVTVSGLTPGRTYRCTVVATNRRGAGPVSARSAGVQA